MVERAVFTLSLDCEGCWGMADQPDLINSGAISDASLLGAYRFISRVLDANRLRATCAFVSGFAAETEAVRAHLSVLRTLASHIPRWYAMIVEAFERGRLDGWRGETLYTSLSDGGHEMAWHGATHVSLADQTPGDVVDLELQLARLLFQAIGHTPRTIVFPRNAVGHLAKLKSFGFEGYRAGRSMAAASRVLALVQEWNVWDRHAKAKPWIENGWQVSPAGLFLNWPAGIRSLVPIAITVRRWKSLLRAAVAQSGYVHMWFHPHNLITAPPMKIAFEEIIKAVGELVHSGDMVNLTIAEANEHFRRDGGSQF